MRKEVSTDGAGSSPVTAGESPRDREDGVGVTGRGGRWKTESRDRLREHMRQGSNMGLFKRQEGRKIGDKEGLGAE